MRSALNIVVVGHVDHGKSTLVGRLLHETGAVPQGRVEAVRRVCEDSGKPFEYAFLLDALEEERDQGITIDVTRVRFSTAARDYLLIDAPGHKEFLKNMVSGAASAEAAVLLVDAGEGVAEQSRRHGYLLGLLGIRQVAVVVNKMDLAGRSREAFERIRAEYAAFLADAGLAPAAFIPVVAREGENLRERSPLMPWYGGPTLVEALDAFAPAPPLDDRPLRFVVQDVYKFDERRIVAGRVETGTVAAGDELVFAPSGKRGVVKGVERWSSARTGPARAGESVGITLTEQLFVERGQIAARPGVEPRSGTLLEASIFWLGERHLAEGGSYLLKLATGESTAEVTRVLEVLDTATLGRGAGSREVARNEVARVVLALRSPLAFDLFADLPGTGRFVLADGARVAGGGIIRGAPAEDWQI